MKVNYCQIITFINVIWTYNVFYSFNSLNVIHPYAIYFTNKHAWIKSTCNQNILNKPVIIFILFWVRPLEIPIFRNVTKANIKNKAKVNVNKTKT